MGGAGKKLREWAGYEFGGIDGRPGNCLACVAHFKKKAASELDRAMRVAQVRQVSAQEIEAISVAPAATPCHSCPKWKLWPENYGLMPANELAVRLFGDARQDVRVGTFAGAPLLRTITLEGVKVILDENSHEFTTWLDRKNTLDKILVLDQVATDAISRIEAGRSANSPKSGPKSREMR